MKKPQRKLHSKGKTIDFTEHADSHWSKAWPEWFNEMLATQLKNWRERHETIESRKQTTT